jgi:hypothetical protein
LRVSILRGHRPTAALLRKQPHSKWNRLDFVLLETYQIYEDEISKDSGYPFWLTRNLDPDISFIVETTTDLAAKELQQWDEKHQGKKAKPGQVRYVVAVDGDGNPIRYGGATRRQFRSAAIQEERDRDDELDEAGVEIERERPVAGYNPADYGDGEMTTPA